MDVTRYPDLVWRTVAPCISMCLMNLSALIRVDLPIDESPLSSVEFDLFDESLAIPTVIDRPLALLQVHLHRHVRRHEVLPDHLEDASRDDVRRGAMGSERDLPRIHVLEPPDSLRGDHELHRLVQVCPAQMLLLPGARMHMCSGMALCARLAGHHALLVLSVVTVDSARQSGAHRV